MLSKVKEVTPVTLYSTTTQVSWNSSSPTTLYEWTIAADSYLTYNWEIKSQWANNYNVYAKLKLFVNGVEQTDYTWSTSSTSWQTKSTVTGVLTQGSNIKVTISSDRSEMGYINNFYLKQHYINGVVGFTPKEKKSIWVFLTWIIFWKEDKHFKGGIITWESTSVITGAITLWNAVGFLEVNNNGKVVKIPYFY